MIVDLQEHSNSKPLEFDLCIVGAGAAGITIANQLKDAPFSICLLEGGGMEQEGRSQMIYQGKSEGYASLDTCRLRYFGGTTNHWAGFCRYPTDQDFEARPWEPLSGWPIKVEQLDGYLRRAIDIVEVGHHFDQSFWASKYNAQSLNLEPRFFNERASLVGPPVRFKTKYKSTLEQAANVHCLLNANVIELLPGQDKRSIHQIKLSDVSGRPYLVKAKRYVVACGGIENARILLASNSVFPTGIGNQHDLVGRYFADHCIRQPGQVILKRRVDQQLIYELGRISEQTYSVYPHIETDRSLSAQQQLPRVIFRLTPEWISRKSRWMETFESFWSGDDYLVSRSYKLLAFAEPVPLAQNRITLTNELDRFGIPKIKLDYNPSGLEVEAIVKNLQEMAKVLGASNRGKVQLDHEKLAKVSNDWGYHHYSTTRMHPDPKQGVVNTDCKVHGMDNLYVAGSSVFPTAGLMTPTMTIVALALRLADKLRATQ